MCYCARGVSPTVHGKQAPPLPRLLLLLLCRTGWDHRPPQGMHTPPLTPLTLIYCIDLDELSKGPGPAQGAAEENGKGETETGDQQAQGAEPPPAEEEREDPSAFLRQEGEDVLAYATRIFNKVYRDDILRLAGMEV